MEIIKQSIGIDISKLTFTACLCSLYVDQKCELSEVRHFSNDKKGFNQLTKWVDKKRSKDLKINYAMEATGVYYESLAYHLIKIGKQVSVLLPNKVLHYGKSLNVKTKTDENDAKVIAMMACERKLKSWTPPLAIYKKLRSICRLYQTVQEDKTQATNRLKQLQCSYKPLKEAVSFHKSTIKRLDKELKKVEKLMEQALRSDDKLWSKVENLLTIKGIGLKTIAIIIGETQGFALIKNQRQLSSYCGYDVVRRESGTSIKAKTKISKKGNSQVRSALYFPAMVASRHNTKLKAVYKRLLANKKEKKVALVALQRRLLVLMYALWKTDQPYNENYGNECKSGSQKEEVPSSSSTQGVESKQEKLRVVGVKRQPTTQNGHLYDQTSEALLHQ